jgi:hypothetical protein
MAQTKLKRLSFVRTALALAATLSLLLAPLCAPLCAARICAGGSASSHCHEVNADPGSGASLAPARVCARADLSAILLKSDERLSPFGSYRAVLSGSTAAQSAETLTFVLAGTHLRFTADASLEHGKSSFASAVLRI